MGGKNMAENNKMLGTGDIDRTREEVKRFGTEVTDYKTHVDKIIDLFNNDATVQSLYESGKFGQTQKENLAAISSALTKYSNVINSDGGLIPATKQFLDSQDNRVQNG